jgi:hypothetical protein
LGKAKFGRRLMERVTEEGAFARHAEAELARTALSIFVSPGFLRGLSQWCFKTRVKQDRE